MAGDTYAKDLAFISKHTKVVELGGASEGKVLVTPNWQGRVMTSSTGGANGPSFGWVNRAFIESGRDDIAFNNYGGEDRFWLGPEAGQFGLWFAKGEPFELPLWKTPRGFNTGKFAVTSQGKRSVAMTAQFDVANYSGTVFNCLVRRAVRLVSEDQAAEDLAVSVPQGVRMVGFETSNTLANGGKNDWTRETGLPSIWILGQFKPLPHGKVIAPFAPGDEKTLGAKATTDYFGKIPADRCRVTDRCVLFSCDGKWRSKIGISPARAKGTLGSYDPDAKVLTLVQFNLPGGAARLPYVNSLWQLQDKPFAGDTVNSYNDGPATPGADSLGGFYELETSSPAAELKRHQAMVHVHRTYHFAGQLAALNDIAVKTLGVELSEIA